jgi:hypothetical protein
MFPITIPGLSQLCCVTADLTDVLTEKAGTNGQLYWDLNYEVAILLRGTKLQAQLWWNRGVSRLFGHFTLILIPLGPNIQWTYTVFCEPKFQ